MRAIVRGRANSGQVVPPFQEPGHVRTKLQTRDDVVAYSRHSSSLRGLSYVDHKLLAKIDHRDIIHTVPRDRKLSFERLDEDKGRSKSDPSPYISYQLSSLPTDEGDDTSALFLS
jgi:hypothetical protein